MWQYIVISLIMLLAVGISVLLIHQHHQSYLQSKNHYLTETTSTTLVARRVRMGFRVLAAMFFLSVQLYAVYNTNFGCFKYYTSWNYLLQLAYWLLVLSTGSTWHTTHWLHDICLTNAFLVALVTWGVLYPQSVQDGTPEDYLNFTSYAQHGSNVVFFVVEFMGNEFLVHPFHGIGTVLWPVVYALFAWIVHALHRGDWWPYHFMTVDATYSPVWYIGLLLLHLIVFALVFGFSTLKRRCLVSTEKNTFNTI